ncbi:MAG TPA: type II toxin-antitoxin system VapC family toxin [Bryobacteraceae bacterium]|nr:type II toxin-antitoxin system VapC family toxin [Bryobacteraceae bacterium]
MARKTECYVDTSAFIALLDRSDSYHGLFRRLFSEPPALATSALVIAEGHGWFLRPYDQTRALQFLAFTNALPDFAVQTFGHEELPKVMQVVKKYADQKLTLADAHGISIMRERNIQTCWSTDRHLGLSGARLVI